MSNASMNRIPTLSSVPIGSSESAQGSPAATSSAFQDAEKDLRDWASEATLASSGSYQQSPNEKPESRQLASSSSKRNGNEYCRTQNKPRPTSMHVASPTPVVFSHPFATRNGLVAPSYQSLPGSPPTRTDFEKPDQDLSPSTNGHASHLGGKMRGRATKSQVPKAVSAVHQQSSLQSAADLSKRLSESLQQESDLQLTAVAGSSRSGSASSLTNDGRTPRASVSTDNSPSSTISSCDSEDDKPLLTPLDESSSLSLNMAHGTSPLSQSFSMDSTPSPETLSNLPADRVGIGFGVGNIGASADVGQLGIGLDGRRGASDNVQSPLEPNGFKARESSSNADYTGSGVPTFSRSTLMHLGMVEGITPPAPAGLPDISNSIEVSSVVSAGLEMGLGVSLAASALINHIPGASSAVSGLAEPRYSRATGGSFDMGSLAMGLKLTDTQIAKPSVPAANLSDKAEESPLTTLEHAESELSRRRTTGWMVGKARADQAPKTGTRHQRSGTHDPVVGNARRNDMSTGTSPGQGPVAVPNRIMFDSLPPAGDANVERNSSIGGGSQARASAGGSTLPETPSLGDKAMLSPDASQHTDSRNPFNSLGPRHGHQQGETRFGRGGRDGQYGNGAAGLGPGHGGLMGIGGGGHFGPGVRAKVAEVLPKLIAGIPLLGQEGETVHIAEYGCLNSRSTQLLQPIISLFAEKAHANQPQREAEPAEVPDYFGRAEVPAMRTIVGGGAPLDMPCRVNFSVTHEDSPQADFRPVTLLLDTSSESYLNPHWQSAHEPSLQNTIFPSFVSRPFASRIVPPSTMHLGMSLMDLHWAHTPRNPAVSLATSAHAELTAFLTARAHEFRKDGVFVMAYISRSEEDRFTAPDRPKSTIDYDSRDMSCGSPLSGSALDDMADGGEAPARGPIKRERTRSNSTPLRPNVLAQNQVTTKKSADIWTTLTNTLAPCLQRLVSCGMLKSDVARHLLSLPMHPRTPRHTQNVLKSVKHLWRLEWSCGLGEGTSELQKDGVIDEDSSVGDATAKSRTGPGVLQSEPEPLRLPHPAWKALQAGTLSRVAFAEHMIQLFKNLYESHFRSVLREKGKLSKGAVEFVLDSLWDILHSRIDDQQPCPIAQCELEVQVVALRRV